VPQDRPSTDDRPDRTPADAPSVGGAYLGISVDSQGTGDDDGVVVSQVADDSPAAEAGLQSGDVITEIDGVDIEDFTDLARVIADHEPGDEVDVTFERDDEDQTVSVTLAERPSSTRSLPDDDSGDAGDDSPIPNFPRPRSSDDSGGSTN
jgi:serine protease Do